MTAYPATTVFTPDRAPAKSAWIQFLADEAGLTVNTIAEAEAYSDTTYIPGVIRVLEANRVYFRSDNETRPRDGVTIIQDATGRRYKALEVTTTQNFVDGLFKTVQPSNGSTWNIPRQSSLMEVRASRNNQILRLPDYISGHTTVVAIKNTATSDRTFTIRTFRTTQRLENLSRQTADRHNFTMQEGEVLFFVNDGSGPWIAMDSDDAFGSPKQRFDDLNASLLVGDFISKESDAAARSVTLSKRRTEIAEPVEWNGVTSPVLNKLHVFTGTGSRSFSATLPTNAQNGDFLAFVKGDTTGNATVTYTAPTGVTIYRGTATAPNITTGLLTTDTTWVFTYKNSTWNLYEGFGALGASLDDIYEAVQWIVQAEANNYSTNDAQRTISLSSLGGSGSGDQNFSGFLKKVTPTGPVTAEFNSIYNITSTSRITLPVATDSDIGKNIWFKNITRVRLTLENIITGGAGQSVSVTLTGEVLNTDDYSILRYAGDNSWEILNDISDMFSGVTLEDVIALDTNTVDGDFRGNNYIKSVSFPPVQNSVPTGAISTYLPALFHLRATGAITVTLPAASADNKNDIAGFRKVSETTNQILTVTSASTINNNPFFAGATSNNTWSQNDQVWFRSNGTSWDYISDISTIYTNQTGVFQQIKSIMPTGTTYDDATETVTAIGGAGGGGSQITERITATLNSASNNLRTTWVNKAVAINNSSFRTIDANSASSLLIGQNGDVIVFGSTTATMNIRARRIGSDSVFTESMTLNDTVHIKKLSGAWYHWDEIE